MTFGTVHITMPPPLFPQKNGDESGVKYFYRCAISVLKRYDRGKISPMICHEINNELKRTLSYVESCGYKTWKGDPTPDAGAYIKIGILTKRAEELEETRWIDIRKIPGAEYYSGEERVSREEWQNSIELRDAWKSHKEFLRGIVIVDFIDENGKTFLFEE